MGGGVQDAGTHVVLSKSGYVPVTSAISHMYHVACFVYIKGRVFFNIFPNYPCNDTNLQ